MSWIEILDGFPRELWGEDVEAKLDDGSIVSGSIEFGDYTSEDSFYLVLTTMTGAEIGSTSVEAVRLTEAHNATPTQHENATDAENHKETDN